ncbi:hypothetical protein FJY69_04015 [candidate division WOR-3 bacterium]|nr:hypothetical protein [candidate division WOR-3 bacterium]
MTRIKPLRLKGRPGHWIALDPRSNRLVSEGRLLREAAEKADRAGVKHPVFNQLPKEACALVMWPGRAFAPASLLRIRGRALRGVSTRPNGQPSAVGRHPPRAVDTPPCRA